MFHTIAQAKGYLRASPDKWRALDEIALETESREVFNFTECYRWVLGKACRAALGEKQNVPCGTKRQDDSSIQEEIRSDEIPNAPSLNT